MKYLPREALATVAHVLDPSGHDFRELLLVDPDHLLLRDVVILVLLQSSVLT